MRWARIVRQEAQLLGLKPQFSILDASDTTQIIAELTGNTDKNRAKALQCGRSPAGRTPSSSPTRPPTAPTTRFLGRALLYRDYDKTLRAYQGVDFDDLIRLPVKFFDEHPEVRERWQNRLRYLLVDEYQDTNRAQYRLLKLLAGCAAFTAVGDDDQAIYAWRGADIENLRQLPVDFPSLRVIKLEQNYRSTTRILNAANTVIANNEKLFEKKLWSEHGAGEPVTVVVACQTPSTRPNRW